MSTYTMHIDAMDQYAAHAVAAKQADRDQMPMTGDRHRAIAAHLQNAQQWARAHCPPGYRVRSTWVLDFVPDVNPVYNGSRGDIYAEQAREARAVHLPTCNGLDMSGPNLVICQGCAVLAPTPT